MDDRYFDNARDSVRILALKMAIKLRLASFVHPDQAASDPVFYELKNLLAKEEAN